MSMPVMPLSAMPFPRLAAALVPLLLTCSSAIVYGAVVEMPAISAVGGAVGAIALILAALYVNRPLWSLDPRRISPHTAPPVAQRNTILMSLAYAWGGISIATCYLFSGLDWYHWWQYAGLMLLIAIGLDIWRGLLTPDSPRLRPLLLTGLRLSILQAVFALGGVSWLVLSGKLTTGKDDWAANIVFVAGGLAIAGISAIAAVTQQRVMR